MSSLLAMPGVKFAIFFVLGILALLYILSIVWVARDSYMRDAPWIMWTVVALVPLVGVIAYCMLRPPLLQIDRDEQELEIAIKKRELMKYGQCAKCGFPVEADYVLCPNCLTKLKNLCPTCGRALDPSWRVCPYCGGTVAATSAIAPRSGASMMASAPSMMEYDEYDDYDDAPMGVSGGAHSR